MPDDFRVRAICIGLLAACLIPRLAAATATARAEFGPEPASREARHVADWVVHYGDNRNHRAGNARKLPFVVVDKRNAKVFVFDTDGRQRGENVLWVDYDGAVSMHRVIATRDCLRRLATPTSRDNRISYDCINIPVRFYETVVQPSFAGTHGIVYVLAENRRAREVFASYDVEDPPPQQSARK